MDLDQQTRLDELESLARDPQSLDEFTRLYAAILEDCQITGDKVMTRALRDIAMRQVRWLKEQRAARPQRFTLFGYGKNN